MKNNQLITIYAIIFIVLISANLVMSFTGSSTSYTSENKFDSVTSYNSSSTSFSQRFIGGINMVGQYIINSFGGRFGILNEDAGVVINLTYPLNNAQIIRGSNLVKYEDDKNVVGDQLNLSAKIYLNSSLVGINSSMCYFYIGGSFYGNSSTNLSGVCMINISKSLINAGINEVYVNYSINGDYNKIESESRINIWVTRYLATSVAGNLRENGYFYHGDNATINISITKINASGSFSYDPINISANATNNSLGVYIDGIKLYPGVNITRLITGNYVSNVSANISFGNMLMWDVYLSDDNYSSYIASANLSNPITICIGDFGDWSDWGTCTSGSQNRTRTDSSLCVESQSQSCSNSIPPSGGPSGCYSTGFGDWTNWSECVNGNQSRYRKDNCNDNQTEIRICDCNPIWQCEGWGECYYGEGPNLSPDEKEIENISEDYFVINYFGSIFENLIYPSLVLLAPDLIQNRSCYDVLSCGTSEGKPSEIQQCYENQINPSSCLDNLVCTSWSDCIAEYSFEEVFNGKIISSGSQRRVCESIQDCINESVQIRSCQIKSKILVKKASWCNEDYIEIYEVDSGKLVTRLKDYKNNNSRKVDVNIYANEGSPNCNYCFDGIKNYDEQEIDCGGENCPVCKTKGKYFDWIWLIKLILLILLIILLLILTYLNKDKIKNFFIRFRKLSPPSYIIKRESYLKIIITRIFEFFSNLIENIRYNFTRIPDWLILFKKFVRPKN